MLAPYLLARRGPGAAVIIGGGSGSSDGIDDPVVTTTSSGDTTVKGKVKPGSFGKIVFPLATVAAGRQYTFRYTPNFSQLAQQGKLAMVGFGFKTNNDFHIVGLRGDGSTGVHKYIVDGTPPNGWNAQTGHTVVDGGASAAGTQAGPNYIRLAVSADGTTYTYSDSNDGVSWSAEITSQAPSPFSNVSGVAIFGIALWFNNADAGPFSITIDQFADVAATTPMPSYWNPGGRGNRTSSITVTTTASLGAGTISKLVDGDFTASTTGGCWFTNGQSSKEIKFDFGSAKVVNAFRWAQDSSSSHGSWVLEGSNDDSSYTGIGSSFTLGGAFLSTYTFTNTAAYRYYKLRQTGGTTSSSPWLLEVEFSILTSGTDAARDALEAGDRSASITVTTTASLGLSSTINNLVDGAFGTNSTDGAIFSGGESTKEIVFDLGTAKIITEFLWLESGSGTFSVGAASHGTWVWEGSNDGSSYTGIGASFTLGGILILDIARTNSTAYRYYRLRQTSGTTSSSVYLVEIEFKIS